MLYANKRGLEMSGKRYLLDTNVIVNLLRGNESLAIKLQCSQWVGISIKDELKMST